MPLSLADHKLRAHHVRCAASKCLLCAEAKGSACDTCIAQDRRSAFVPSRVADAVLRAAATNTYLPSTFERNCGFAAKGRLLFSDPIITRAHVEAQEEAALTMMQVMKSSTHAYEWCKGPQ